MKHKLITLLLLIIPFAVNGKRMNPNSRLNGEYKIINYVKTEKGKLYKFSAKKNEVNISNSMMHINIGCNTISTNTDFNIENKIACSDILGTKMACNKTIAAQEKSIHKILNAIDNYKIKGNNISFYKGSKKMMEIQKINNLSRNIATTTALNGNYRIIKQIENGVTTERNTFQTNIEFDHANKTFSANVGCNNINGKINKTGTNKIGFDAVMSTLKACLNETEIIENSFINNMKNVKSYITEANHVYLYDGENLVLMLEKVN